MSGYTLVNIESAAEDLWYKIKKIQAEARYVGQVNQSPIAAKDEFIRRVMEIMRKHGPNLKAR